MTKGKPYKLRVHPMRDEQDEFVVEAEIVEDAEIVVDAEIVEGAEIENAISSAPDVRSKKPDQLSNPTSIQREPNRVPSSEEPTIMLRVRRSARNSESVPELIYRKNIHPGKVIENIGNFPPTVGHCLCFAMLAPYGGAFVINDNEGSVRKFEYKIQRSIPFSTRCSIGSYRNFRQPYCLWELCFHPVSESVACCHDNRRRECPRNRERV